MKPDLWVMCGIPGSGKSTHVKLIKKHISNKAVVLSSDNIRVELAGKGEKVSNDKVFNILHQRMNKVLATGQAVILDACHTSRKQRAHIFNKLEHDCCKHVHICNLPFDECVKRDAMRKEKVGAEVVEKFYNGFEIPFHEEGWDNIELVYYNSEGCDGTYDWYLEAIEGFDQNSKHHKYNLDVHCYKTFGHMIDLLQHCEELPSDNNRLSLLYAALFHDYGKIFTQTTGQNGESHYYNHENVGTYEFVSDSRFLKIFEKYDDDEILLDTLFYINYHMRPFTWNSDKWGANKWRRIFGENKAKYLLMLHEADVFAAGENMDDN